MTRTPTPKEVGRKVRAARIKAGFKAQDVAARAAGLHPNTLGDIESGRRYPRFIQVVQMHRAWNTNPGDILAA